MAVSCVFIASVGQSQPPVPQPPLQVAPVELPPVPKVNIPKPPVPTPRPKEKPPPKPQIIDYRDFTKEHPKDKPKPRPVAPRPDISVHLIDVPKLIISRNPSPSRPSPQLSPQQMSALDGYSSRLSSRINAAWVKPAQRAGVRLVAKVVFDVLSSGQITNVRLRPGSGNNAFDQSILTAFRNASSAGPTPTGQSHEFSMSFQNWQ